MCAELGGFAEPTSVMITNGSFYNPLFCYALTGKAGAVTFNDYAFVEDLGFLGRLDNMVLLVDRDGRLL